MNNIHLKQNVSTFDEKNKLNHEMKKPRYFYFLNKSWLIIIGNMLHQVTGLFWYVIPLRNST